jgi:branched-chain amino acid transport system ATP-binding protein
MSEPILKIRGLTAGYGDVQVLWGIDMDVMPGSITCVIGSNGAGKSTLMRTISGLVKANSGEIEFCSSSLKNAAPKDVLRAGIAHVP